MIQEQQLVLENLVWYQQRGRFSVETDFWISSLADTKQISEEERICVVLGTNVLFCVLYSSILILNK